LKPPVLLNRDQAARYLGVKKNTLSAWASTGRYNLPYIKVGHLVKYRVEDLEAFLQRGTIKDE
jgi:excisionase family DNA binding protein